MTIKKISRKHVNYILLGVLVLILLARAIPPPIEGDWMWPELKSHGITYVGPEIHFFHIEDGIVTYYADDEPASYVGKYTKLDSNLYVLLDRENILKEANLPIVKVRWFSLSILFPEYPEGEPFIMKRSFTRMKTRDVIVQAKMED